jgi:hypothetical protein
MNRPMTKPTTPITMRIRPAVWMSMPATVAVTAYLRIAPTAIRKRDVPMVMPSGYFSAAGQIIL